jgi:hypothetical protein
VKSVYSIYLKQDELFNFKIFPFEMIYSDYEVSGIIMNFFKNLYSNEEWIYLFLEAEIERICFY